MSRSLAYIKCPSYPRHVTFRSIITIIDRNLNSNDYQEKAKLRFHCRRRAATVLAASSVSPNRCLRGGVGSSTNRRPCRRRTRRCSSAISTIWWPTAAPVAPTAAAVASVVCLCCTIWCIPKRSSRTRSATVRSCRPSCLRWPSGTSRKCNDKTTKRNCPLVINYFIILNLLWVPCVTSRQMSVCPVVLQGFYFLFNYSAQVHYINSKFLFKFASVWYSTRWQYQSIFSVCLSRCPLGFSLVIGPLL